MPSHGQRCKHHFSGCLGRRRQFDATVPHHWHARCLSTLRQSQRRSRKAGFPPRPTGSSRCVARFRDPRPSPRGPWVLQNRDRHPLDPSRFFFSSRSPFPNPHSPAASLPRRLLFFLQPVSFSRSARGLASSCRRSIMTSEAGAWRSLASAPEWGSGGRWFESSRPDIARPVGNESRLAFCRLSSAVEHSFRKVKSSKKTTEILWFSCFW
jgi:hypothetical protein